MYDNMFKIHLHRCKKEGQLHYSSSRRCWTHDCSHADEKYHQGSKKHHFNSLSTDSNGSVLLMFSLNNTPLTLLQNEQFATIRQNECAFSIYVSQTFKYIDHYFNSIYRIFCFCFAQHQTCIFKRLNTTFRFGVLFMLHVSLSCSQTNTFVFVGLIVKQG